MGFAPPRAMGFAPPRAIATTSDFSCLSLGWGARHPNLLGDTTKVSSIHSASTSSAITLDGKTLVSGSADKTIKMQANVLEGVGCDSTVA